MESYKSAEEEWTTFKEKFSKKYDTEEEEKRRFEIFKASLAKIKEHNEKYEKQEVSWFMGVNNFADLTEEEMKSRFCGVKKPSE